MVGRFYVDADDMRTRLGKGGNKLIHGRDHQMHIQGFLGRMANTGHHHWTNG